MNIHLLLILLSWKAPQRAELDVMLAPQIVCPLSMDEYRTPLKAFRARKALLEALKRRV